MKREVQPASLSSCSAPPLFVLSPCEWTIPRVFLKEARKHVGIVIAKFLRDNTHLRVGIEGEEILRELQARLYLECLHIRLKVVQERTFESANCHTELWRKPRKPEPWMAVIENNEIVRHACWSSKFWRKLPCKNLASNLTNQLDRLLLDRIEMVPIAVRHRVPSATSRPL